MSSVGRQGNWLTSAVGEAGDPQPFEPGWYVGALYVSAALVTLVLAALPDLASRDRLAILVSGIVAAALGAVLIRRRPSLGRPDARVPLRPRDLLDRSRRLLAHRQGTCSPCCAGSRRRRSPLLPVRAALARERLRRGRPRGDLRRDRTVRAQRARRSRPGSGSSPPLWSPRSSAAAYLLRDRLHRRNDVLGQARQRTLDRHRGRRAGRPLSRRELGPRGHARPATRRNHRPAPRRPHPPG